MAQSWPHQEFGEYLRAAMTAAQVPDFAELSRLSDVSQTQLSNWRRGLAQPSRASLRKIATALGIQPVRLYFAAGLNDPDETDIGQGMIDPATLPAELRELIDMYLHQLNDEQRSYTRRTIAYVTAGLRDEVARSQVKPIKRSRSA